jgi:hypothetical protein
MTTKVERLDFTDLQFAANFDALCASNAVQGRKLASAFMPPGTTTVVLLFVS